MTKQFSQAGIKLVAKLEGCILHEYKDSAGVPTIGYGHTGGVYEGQRITQAQADELLRKDLAKFVDRVNKFVKVPINQNQFDALVIFDFNTGSLGTSTLLKKLNAGDYKGAAAEFDVWNKITNPNTGKKVVSQGLVNRRNAEQALFNTPVPATPVAKPVVKKPAPKITHKVVHGETLSQIAVHYKTTVAALVKLNGLKDANHIQVGQVLKIN